MITNIPLLRAPDAPPVELPDIEKGYFGECKFCEQPATGIAADVREDDNKLIAVPCCFGDRCITAFIGYKHKNYVGNFLPNYETEIMGYYLAKKGHIYSPHWYAKYIQDILAS